MDEEQARGRMQINTMMFGDKAAKTVSVAAELRIADDRPTSGVIEFEAQALGFGGNALGIGWLPRFIEVTAANEHLLEPFRVSAEKLCSPLP